MNWARILAYVTGTGTVDQKLLLRNEYLAAEIARTRVELRAVIEMLAVEHSRSCGVCLRQQSFQHALSLDQRCGARIEAINVQEVKGVVDHVVMAAALKIVLERGETRPAVRVG